MGGKGVREEVTGVERDGVEDVEGLGLERGGRQRAVGEQNGTMPIEIKN